VSGFDSIAIEDVPVEDALAKLAKDENAVLVDVRTRAEWAFVGVADLSSVGKQPLLMEWQGFPDNRVNPAFVEQLAEALNRVGADKTTELLFICRSGGRSLMAARAMASAGFTRCRNVTDGFEGGLDPGRHRGRLGGWKAQGLPWVQG
jgi:rhodanese-related sulfurtransferase